MLCLLTMGPCHPRTLSGAPQSPATGRRGSEVASPGVRRQHVISEDTGQQCTEMRSQYLRSQCRDNGFLTVQRNRVLVQTTGLNTTHVEGKRVTMKNVTHTRSHGILAFCLHFIFLMNGWMYYKDDCKKNVCLLHDIIYRQLCLVVLCYSWRFIEFFYFVSEVTTWTRGFLYDNGIRLGSERRLKS